MARLKTFLAGSSVVLIFLAVLFGNFFRDIVQAVGDWTNSTYGIDYSAGNIGIGGTASQTIRLDVTGNMRTKVASDGGSVITVLPANGSSQNYGMTATNAGGLFLGRTSGSGSGVNTDIFISTAGKVGMGTSSPSATFDLTGTSRSKLPGNGISTLVVQPADGTSQSYGMTAINGGGFYLGHTAGPGQGVGSEFRIYGNGDVCLGNC